MNIACKTAIFAVSSIKSVKIRATLAGRIAMRKRFEIEYEKGATPIEEVKIPEKSRDELPAVLRGLQHIHRERELNKAVLDLLEERFNSREKNKGMGRPGMSLWEILVLAVVRLALGIDYDRLEHIANYDLLVREILGVVSFGKQIKRYSLQAIKDNVGILDEKTIEEINEIIIKAGHRLVKKRIKV
ncbi:MAG: hypothetical protein ACE5H1_08475 [Thermodesulfobacteriota bacterium]